VWSLLLLLLLLLLALPCTPLPALPPLHLLPLLVGVSPVIRVSLVTPRVTSQVAAAATAAVVYLTWEATGSTVTCSSCRTPLASCMLATATATAMRLGAACCSCSVRLRGLVAAGGGLAAGGSISAMADAGMTHLPPSQATLQPGGMGKAAPGCLAGCCCCCCS
jgi:hypothetical protein